MSTQKPRISVTLTPKEYDDLKRIAAAENISLAEVARKYIMQGLAGQLTENNLEFIVPVIREQLSDIIRPSVERLAKLSAKTCVQAGCAAYLSAEAILKFVPQEEQLDVEESYEAARRKAIRYLQGGADAPPNDRQ